MKISDTERRWRLVHRHHLARTAVDALEATRGVAALHSSDPLTPYLATRARVDGFENGHLDEKLWGERSLWRMHAMRRTLFVVPREDVPAFEAGAAREVAARERKRLLGWLAAEMTPQRADGWLTEVGRQTTELLQTGGEWSTQEVMAEIPELERKILVGSGRWATTVPVGSRLLFVLAMQGDIVRTRPGGSWRSSQWRWAAVSYWQGQPLERLDEEEGRVRIIDRYLASHGPATMKDLRWWTGWTVRKVEAALAALGVVTVEVGSGEPAYVLAGDTDSGPPAANAVAFLPGLDPTPMGWKERNWYVGRHGDRLFDSNGNVGPTIWAGGRMVGGWGQRPDGSVEYELLEEVEDEVAERVEVEAAALGEWMDGEVAVPRFRTPLEKELSG
jgi:hypothetical protein